MTQRSFFVVALDSSIFRFIFIHLRSFSCHFRANTPSSPGFSQRPSERVVRSSSRLRITKNVIRKVNCLQLAICCLVYFFCWGQQLFVHPSAVTGKTRGTMEVLACKLKFYDPLFVSVCLCFFVIQSLVGLL